MKSGKDGNDIIYDMVVETVFLDGGNDFIDGGANGVEDFTAIFQDDAIYYGKSKIIS